MTDLFGVGAGGGNIFANGEGEDAIVFISGEIYSLPCGEDDVAEGTFPIGTGKTPIDNQQDSEDKDSGAGDDQQVPDNQQSGGGKGTVTKTFELTLNGTVPEDRAFGVAYGTFDDFDADEDTIVIFCGQPDPQIGDVVVSDEDCVGDGETYTYSAELPVGTELYFTYLTAVEGDEENTAEPFFGNITFEGPGEAEVLDADMTNTAWYTFGKGTGAGDEQETPDNQQEGEKPDTGAGEVPDNQQDDEQETPDDQQGEMPDELPDTGAGGLAGGLPLGSAAAVASLLAASAYGAIRRR